jgi:hypothetical protein
MLYAEKIRKSSLYKSSYNSIFLYTIFCSETDSVDCFVFSFALYYCTIQLIDYGVNKERVYYMLRRHKHLTLIRVSVDKNTLQFVRQLDWLKGYRIAQ